MNTPETNKKEIKKFLQQDITLNDLHSELLTYAGRGNIQLINFLLSSSQLEKVLTLDETQAKKVLALACVHDRLKMVEYLLLGEFKHYFTQPVINHAFTIASFNEKKRIMQYLLSNSSLSIHADINFINPDFPQASADIQGTALSAACKMKSMLLVKFLLTSDQITIHSDINLCNDLAFRTSYQEQDIEMLSYFIMEHNVQCTDDILIYMEKLNSDADYQLLFNDINKLFIYRKLNNMPSYDKPIKIHKI